MKRLIALITTAALLCPMWATAQTSTTPSTMPSVTWTGSLVLPSQDSVDYQLLPRAGYDCDAIKMIYLSITVPNNHSAVKGVNGYFDCYGSSFAISDNPPFSLSGNLIALNSDGQVTGPNDAVSTYKATLNLGGLVLYCSVQASNLNMSCNAGALTGGQLPSLSGTFSPQR
jgi:hypothetical protein